jgi:hypothetical protein
MSSPKNAEMFQRTDTAELRAACLLASSSEADGLRASGGAVGNVERSHARTCG